MPPATNPSARRAVPWLGALFLLVGPACAPARQPREVGVISTAPLVIELRAIGGPGLAARLVNRGRDTLAVLHDVRLQPSRPVLTDAAGDTLEPFDRRALMKFDGTLYCREFQPLAPGATRELGEARFRRGEGGWTLAWGPFEYDGLPAGRYRVRLTWTSEAAECQETRDAAPRAVAGAWLGTVESAALEVTLK